MELQLHLFPKFLASLFPTVIHSNDYTLLCQQTVPCSTCPISVRCVIHEIVVHAGCTLDCSYPTRLVRAPELFLFKH